MADSGREQAAFRAKKWSIEDHPDPPSKRGPFVILRGFLREKPGFFRKSGPQTPDLAQIWGLRPESGSWEGSWRVLGPGPDPGPEAGSGGSWRVPDPGLAGPGRSWQDLADRVRAGSGSGPSFRNTALVGVF